MFKVMKSLLIIVAVAAVAGTVTYSSFSDAESIDGNTVSTATVDLDIQGLATGEIEKPLIVESLVPSEWTNWARAELHNMSTVTVNSYMYVENVIGEACDKVNLQVTTGHVGGNEQERDVYNDALLGLQGIDNWVEVTGVPPFEAIPVQGMQVIQQRAQLDETADNNYQNTSCTWDEVFVIENVPPTQ